MSRRGSAWLAALPLVRAGLRFAAFFRAVFFFAACLRTVRFLAVFCRAVFFFAAFFRTGFRPVDRLRAVFFRAGAFFFLAAMRPFLLCVPGTLPAMGNPCHVRRRRPSRCRARPGRPLSRSPARARGGVRHPRRQTTGPWSGVSRRRSPRCSPSCARARPGWSSTRRPRPLTSRRPGTSRSAEIARAGTGRDPRAR